MISLSRNHDRGGTTRQHYESTKPSNSAEAATKINNAWMRMNQDAIKQACNTFRAIATITRVAVITKQ